jgi:hypothetical protein
MEVFQKTHSAQNRQDSWVRAAVNRHLPQIFLRVERVDLRKRSAAAGAVGRFLKD